MPLAGTFDVLDFAGVLGLLVHRGSTGRLQVRTDSIQASIWLAGGQSVVAEVTSGSAGEAKAKGRRLLEDICFDAMKSPRGSFEFQGQDEVERLSEERIDLESVMEAARDRLEQWRQVESVIQSFDSVPRLAAQLEDEITVDNERWKVLVAIDGRRNVASLARRLGMELLPFCQLLKPLIEEGALAMDHPKGGIKSLPKVRLERPPGDGDIPVFGAADLAGAIETATGAEMPPAGEGTPGDTTSGETASGHAASGHTASGDTASGDEPPPEDPARAGGSEAAGHAEPTYRAGWGRRRVRIRHVPGAGADATNGV